MIISDPYFYLTAIPALLIYGIGKGGLGGALGVVAVPLMALTTAPTQAAAIMLPLLCVMDVFAVKMYYSFCDWHQIKRLLPGAFVGILLAYLYLSKIPEYGLKLMIGSLSLGFCFQYMIKVYRNRHVTIETEKPGIVSAYFWGVLSGFSSMAIHAGGAPLNVYLLPQRLEKFTFIATMAVFFAIVNAVKLVPYTLLNEFNQTNLMTALILTPLALIGVKLGVLLLRKVSQERIYQICYLFLFISGSKLFWDGLTKLI